jgi:HEAT repeat protein
MAALRITAPLLLCSVAWAAAGTEGSAPATSAPATSLPTSSVPWGEAKAGLGIQLAASGPSAIGRDIIFSLKCRNEGAAAVALGEPKAIFGWLRLAVGPQQEYLSQRLAIEPAGQWPRELAPGAVLEFEPIALKEAHKLYAVSDARSLLTAWLADKQPAVEPAGDVKRLLGVGEVKARITLYVPRANEPAVALQSAVLELTVEPPDLTRLSAQQRAAFVEQLRKQFKASEWGGQQAHHTAVKLGPAVVPDLIDAVADRSAPSYARMWLATALADIRDAKAAAALVKLLDDPDGGVRACVGYHGPKQQSAALDEAIVAKAASGGDAGFTAYALVGFMAHRGEAPQRLLEAGLSSSDAKVQSAVRAALKNYASDYNVQRLQKLAQDADPKVAATAADMLKAMGKQSQGR